jgi:phosphate transport system ATP-binding protein
MNDTIRHCRVTGQVLLGGEDSYAEGVDPVSVRARVGMVFRKPNLFPTSMCDHIVFGSEIDGLRLSAWR